MRLGVDQLAGDVDLGAVGGGVHDRLPELRLDLALAGLAQLALDVGAELVEGVEAARVGGEVVVQLGEALLLDLLHGHGELGVASGQLLGPVVGGEGEVHRPLLTGTHALQPLLEALD